MLTNLVELDKDLEISLDYQISSEESQCEEFCSDNSDVEEFLDILATITTADISQLELFHLYSWFIIVPKRP